MLLLLVLLLLLLLLQQPDCFAHISAPVLLLLVLHGLAGGSNGFSTPDASVAHESGTIYHAARARCAELSDAVQDSSSSSGSSSSSSSGSSSSGSSGSSGSSSSIISSSCISCSSCSGSRNRLASHLSVASVVSPSTQAPPKAILCLVKESEDFEAAGAYDEAAQKGR